MRLLLIDDEPDLRELLKLAFGLEAGCEVVGSAATLSEATELARATQPDVIVTDLVFGLAGSPAELLSQLRQAAPGAAVVVFSGKEVPADAAPIGADAVLLKGGDLSELVEKVNELGR